MAHGTPRKTLNDLFVLFANPEVIQVVLITLHELNIF